MNEINFDMKKHIFTIIIGCYLGFFLLSYFGKKVITSDYRLSVSKQIEKTSASSSPFSLNDLYTALKKNDPNTLLIDIRSAQEYEKGHLPSAISIPVHELFSAENADIIVESPHLQKILYGIDESSAVKAQIILLQNGLSGFKTLNGGYEIAKKHIVDSKNPSYFFYSDEKQKFNYGKLMPSGSSSASKTKKSAEKVEVKAPRGGC